MKISRIIILGFILYLVYQCSEMCGGVRDAPNEVEPIYTEAQRDSIKQLEHMDNMEDMAYRVARRYVRQSLNHPKTADFPILSQPLIENQGDSTFLVSHYVDAKNSFGVEGRLHYTAKVQYAGGDVDNEINWVLWDLKTDE